MKRLVLIALLFPWSLKSAGQHCPWDGTSFIMVAPAEKMKVISMFLLDSNYNKVTSNWYSGPVVPRVDTARFWKNSDWKPGEPSTDGRVQNFPFAGDNYVVSFGQYKTGMRYYLQVVYNMESVVDALRIKLDHKNIHPLCTSNKELWNGTIKPLLLTTNN